MNAEFCTPASEGDKDTMTFPTPLPPGVAQIRLVSETHAVVVHCTVDTKAVGVGSFVEKETPETVKVIPPEVALLAPSASVMIGVAKFPLSKSEKIMANVKIRCNISAWRGNIDPGLRGKRSEHE